MGRCAEGRDGGREVGVEVWVRTAASILLFAACLAGSAFAQDAQKPASPGLDRLLKLPANTGYTAEEKGGLNRSAWRQRFADARGALADAERKLAESQKKLAEVAGGKSEWRFTPPGVPAQGDGESSVSFQLREEVRRNRNERDRAQRRLRELNVEANLAGIPDDWRSPSTVAPSSDGPDHETGTDAAKRP
jgi:hypothetical protein